MLQMSIGKRFFPFCPAVQRDHVRTSLYSLFTVFLTNGVILRTNTSWQKNMFLFCYSECFFLSARDPDQTIRLPLWTACGSQRPVSRSEVSLAQRASAQKGPGLTATDPWVKERIQAKRRDWQANGSQNLSASYFLRSQLDCSPQACTGWSEGAKLFPLSSFYQRDAVRAVIFSSSHMHICTCIFICTFICIFYVYMYLYVYVYLYVHEGANGASLYWASQNSKITLPTPPFFSFPLCFLPLIEGDEGDYLSVLFTHPYCVHQLQVQINQKYACSTWCHPGPLRKRFLNILLGDWATESY